MGIILAIFCILFFEKLRTFVSFPCTTRFMIFPKTCNLELYFVDDIGIEMGCFPIIDT